MVITHALINFSLSPWLGGWGGATTGVQGQRNGKLHVGKLHYVCYRMTIKGTCTYKSDNGMDTCMCNSTHSC